MSHLIASQKVIQHYLKALLTEEDSEQTAKTALADEQKAQLNKLLAQAVPVATPQKTVAPPATTTPKRVVAPVTAVKPAPVVIPEEPLAKLKQLAEKAPVDNTVKETAIFQREIPVAQRLADALPTVKKAEKAYRNSRFQALFFSVAGLKVAVPLIELGGIHELSEINSLFGKPNWFKGVMLYREQKFNVVDTARWVMPEKYDEILAQGLNYQYLVMLGNSNWGLCCETLIDTITLEPEQIKWREQEGKRPWMAGLIKEHMCVLVDVDELINLLSRGLDINA